MKKIKLTLDKLVVGSLTAAEQKMIIGGYDGEASVVVVNNQCVGTSAPTYEKSSFLAGCPVTTAPTSSCSSAPYQSCHHG